MAESPAPTVPTDRPDACVVPPEVRDAAVEAAAYDLAANAHDSELIGDAIEHAIAGRLSEWWSICEREALDVAVGEINAREAERDAALAEVERLRAENERLDRAAAVASLRFAATAVERDEARAALDRVEALCAEYERRTEGRPRRGIAATALRAARGTTQGGNDE